MWTQHIMMCLGAAAMAAGMAPRNAAEWWAQPAVPIQVARAAQGRTCPWERTGPFDVKPAPTPDRVRKCPGIPNKVGMQTGAFAGEKTQGLPLARLVDEQGHKRIAGEDGTFHNKARKITGGVRLTMPKLHLLPRHMLWLLAQRLMLETWTSSTATALPDVYKQIFIDEKCFPEMIESFRRTAMDELLVLEQECKSADDSIYLSIVPPHLHPVLQYGNRRRAVTAVWRICRRMGWPDVELATAIAKGFEADDAFKEGKGLAEANVAVDEHKPDWLDFLSTPPMTDNMRKPNAWNDEILGKLEIEVEKLLEAGRLVECKPEDIRVPCGKLFPKVEWKEASQTEKVRVLSDERFRNSHLQCAYSLKLVGARQHVEWLGAALAPPGEECTRKVPTSQSRRDLWRQCQYELKMVMDAQDFSDEKTMADSIAGTDGPRIVAAHIRKAMKWVNRKKFLKKKADQWASHSDAVCSAHGPTADSTTLGALLPDHPLAQDPADPRAEFGRASCSPELGTRDFQSAYYLVGIRNPDTSPVCFWSVKDQKWRFAKSSVLNMGGAFSVPSWGRISNFMSAASAALLKVCAPIYIDDTALISQRRTMESADEAYMVLARVCGIVMSEKKEANQKSTETNKVRLLGLDYTWKRPLALRNASDARTAQEPTVIHVTVPESTLAKTRDAAQEVLRGLNKHDKESLVKHKTIQKLVGGANFAACAAGSRSGGELLRPMYKWLQPEFFEAKIRCENERTNLRHAVKGICCLLDNPRPIIIRSDRDREMFVLVTDASGRDMNDETGLLSEPWLGALLFTPDGDVHVTKRSAHDEPLSDNIAILEAKAVQMGFATWAPLLKDKDVLCYCDNQNAAYAFVKIGSKNAHITKIAVDVCTWAYINNTNTFFQYIRTDLNPADSLTRENWEELQELLPDDAVWTPFHDAREDAEVLRDGLRNDDSARTIRAQTNLRRSVWRDRGLCTCPEAGTTEWSGYCGTCGKLQQRINGHVYDLPRKTGSSGAHGRKRNARSKNNREENTG